MRTHHVIAVVAVIVIGVGLKLIFFTAPTAEAVSFSVKRASVDASQLHRNVKDSPAEKSHGAPLTFGDE